MKKQFILSLVLATTVMATQAHAAPMGRGGKSVRDVLADYVKDIKKYAFEGKTTANELSAQQSRKAQDRLMGDLKLSTAEKTSINSVIATSKDKSAITNSLATILAAKNMSAGKVDVESRSINEAADASIKLLSNAPLIGEKISSSTLSKTELLDTNTALNKLVTMPEKFITFETKERDSYTKVIKKADELSVKSETFEDAFVKAIMEVQGVSKDKAMEIVRKLKDCV